MQAFLHCFNSYFVVVMVRHFLVNTKLPLTGRSHRPKALISRHFTFRHRSRLCSMPDRVDDGVEESMRCGCAVSRVDRRRTAVRRRSHGEQGAADRDSSTPSSTRQEENKKKAEEEGKRPYGLRNFLKRASARPLWLILFFSSRLSSASALPDSGSMNTGS